MELLKQPVRRLYDIRRTLLTEIRSASNLFSITAMSTRCISNGKGADSRDVCGSIVTLESVIWLKSDDGRIVTHGHLLMESQPKEGGAERKLDLRSIER